MTKVQYGKLLILQANKRMADELRQEKAQGATFAKARDERFNERMCGQVETVTEQRRLATAAVEGQRLRNLETVRVESSIGFL